MSVVDIRPATFDQARLIDTKTMIAVEGEVGEIAKRIEEIHPSLGLSYSSEAGCYCVWQETVRPNGEPQRAMVTTSQTADDRLVNRIRYVVWCAEHGVDVAAEADAVDAAADKLARDQLSDIAGDVAERLWHAGTQHGLDQKQKIIPVYRRTRAR